MRLVLRWVASRDGLLVFKFLEKKNDFKTVLSEHAHAI